MIDKANDVDYMTKYLRYALEFEKSVYIWTNALMKLDTRIKNNNNEIQRLRSVISNSNQYLKDFDDDEQLNVEHAEFQYSQYKKKAKKFLIFFAVFVLFSLLSMLAFVTIIDSGDGSTSTESDLFAAIIPITTITCSTFIVPICIFAPIYFLYKAWKVKSQSKLFSSDNFRNRKKQIYQEELNIAQTDLKSASIRAENYTYRRKEVVQALQEAHTTLNKIYSEDVLHPEYQDLYIVAALCSYLEKGRCNTIKGHGGIYDTYDTEKIQIAQLASMHRIEERLDEISGELGAIYQEIKSANNTLNSIDMKMDNSLDIQRSINSNVSIGKTYLHQISLSNSYNNWR